MCIVHFAVKQDLLNQIIFVSFITLYQLFQSTPWSSYKELFDINKKIVQKAKNSGSVNENGKYGFVLL